MKKPVILLAGCFTLLVGFNFMFMGCSSAPTSAAPTTIIQGEPTATPYCSSPSTQGLTAIGATFGPLSATVMYAQAVTLASAETATSLSIHFDAPVTVGQFRFAFCNGDGVRVPWWCIVQTN